LQRSYGFPGWCAICRWTAVGAISVGTMAVLGAATSDHRPAPTVVRLAAQPEGTGLDWAGWTVRDPAEQRRSLDLLLNREKDRRAPAAKKVVPASIVSRSASVAPASPSSIAIPQSALGQSSTLAAPQAVSVAIRYALAQVGKPYVWGATGPGSYDCSGLVQRSYAMAGVALPRTSREQARVGKAVELPDLLPGDLLFWAYDPSNLATVHHVAIYLGDGKIVQAPQPGEFVEVTTMWLSGYAGAVRVATGPATAALPPVPVGVPGTGITPVGDAMPDGSPPPPVLPPADSPPRIQHRSGASSQGGTTSPDGTPATGTKDSTSPGSTTPGTTSPGGSTGSASPGTTSPGSSSPGTTSPGSSASGGGSPAGSQQPSGSTSGTGAPATSSATPDPTTPAPTSSEPHRTTPAPPPSSTPPPPPSTTPAPPSSTPPPPAPSPSGDSAASATTSAPPQPSVSPSSATPSPT
jgi:cell wall-associated NlpC family hydrolase